MDSPRGPLERIVRAWLRELIPEPNASDNGDQEPECETGGCIGSIRKAARAEWAEYDAPGAVQHYLDDDLEHDPKSGSGYF
jgi:hypothetical protein